MNDADIDLSDIKKREPGAPAPGALAAPLDIDLSDVPKRDTTVQDNYRSVVDNKISPDHAAKVINISKVSGLPPELVASDIDTAQKAFEMPDFDVIKAHAPYTHDFLKDKGNMAMASDSIRNLVDIERTIKAHNAIQAFGAGFSSTGLGMALNRELPAMEIPEEAPMTQKFAGMLGGFVGDFPAMVAGGIAGAVPAALSGPVAAPFVASAATFAAPAAFRQAMIEHYQNPDLDAAQLFKSAYSVGKEALKGAAVGALTATGAAAGARLVTGPAIKGAGFTMKAAVPAGKLAAAKTVGELAGMTVGGAAVEGELPKGQDIVGNAALVGLLHGVGAITGAVRNVRLAEMQAENTKAYLGRMRELVSDTKLREIDAGTMNKILNDQASPVYVPVEAFNTLFQSKGVDPVQAASELGLSGSHAEAIRTNGDVEIPMGTYMSKRLEPFHVELEKDVKVDPEHPTENQRINSAKELNEVAKDINGKAEKLFKEKPDTKAAYELIREDIVKRQSIFSDIKDEGAKKNAEQAADVLAKYFAVQGDALGKDPLQVYEEKGLRMYGPEQQVSPTMLQRELAPATYSKLTRTIEEKMPNSATAEQVMGIIKNSGVKQEEMDVIGLEQFLSENPKPSKEELLAHLEGNQVQIQDVTKGKGKGPTFEQWRSENSSSSESEADARARYDRYLELGDPVSGSIETDTKFSQYTLPGGDNYREVLFTLPGKGRPSDLPPGYSIKTDEYGYTILNEKGVPVSTSENHMEAFDMAMDKAYGKKTEFKSAHFDEPNILAHVRLNDRMVNGKRVLFIEEVQSDWHQKGREKGYKTEKATKLPEGYKLNESKKGFWYSLAGLQVTSSHPTLEMAKKEALEYASSGEVPNAPLKKTWHEYVMKRAIRMAAEEGYDAIAWTTGEQQAARYDLSKQVDRIDYFKHSEKVVAYKNGEEVLSTPAKEGELSGVIGKEAASKILDPKNSMDSGNSFSLRGNDLKVGGEGMAGFYDQMLPSFVNKFTKKWGGKVDETKIKLADNQQFTIEKVGDVYNVTSGDTGKMYPFNTYKEAEGFVIEKTNKELSADVHSLTITPAMREAALYEGFPMFQRPGESLGKAEAPKSPEGLVQRPIEAPETVNEKQAPMHKDVTPEVAKMAKVIPQSLGAGRIPKPVENAIESVNEAGQEMLERILSNPDIFPTVSGSPIKDNADYGPTFTPTNNCPKGEKLTKNVLAVRDFLDQKLEGKDAKEKSNIKTAAARKLLAAGVAQGLETPCLQCYTVEKQLIGYSAKPFSLGQKMYEHGQIDSSVDFLKSHGSILRGYGTADFISSDIPSIIKLGQDLAAHKIGAGFYTKSLWMPEIFGDTGMKFNISVGEHLHVGIPVEVAKAYRERYKNVGIVAIAINEAQVKKFGENPDVDLIIPTHLGGGTPADFLSDITGMKWESFTREQGEKITVDGKSVGLNSPTANGIKNIEKARDMVKKGSYNRDKAEYLAAIEKAKALTGVEISPKFPDYVKEKWYGKLIGTGPGEYGKTADLPQIDMSKMNLDKAREYFMTASEDKTALDNKYASMARTIAKEGMKGGVDAINALNPKTLYQAFTPASEGGKSEPLASYTKTQEGSIIKMFKGANASSFIHEIGHFILEDVKKVAESGQAPAEYAAEWKTIQAYLSHESGKEISVEQHERFAQSFEKYIMEGVAPIPELKTSFQKMRDWMLQVYDGVKRKLGVEITPEIRGVFDRLLAGKEAIDAAKAEMGPDSEIASLKGDALRARQMAEEMLIKPVMAQLSADNKAKMEQERIIAQAEAIVEVDKLPVYSAIKDLEGIAFLKEQRLTEQMIRNEADKYVQGELSEERVSLFDSVAQLNGFSSGDELLKKIYTSDTRDVARAKLVDEKMSKFEKVNTAALKEEALKVLHTGDNMGKLIALESQVLEGMRMSKEISAEITKARRELASQEWEQAKAQAAETLGNDKEWKKAIKFRLYYTLERKAAEQSAKLLANKDIEGAMKAKREQLVSHAFAAEALRLKDRTARNIKFLEGQQSADKTSFKKEEHFLQVAALLNRFGLKREDFKQEDRGESLSQWVERAALHYGEIVSAIPAWLQNEAISKDINSLTANQLKDLRDTVAHIRHIANNENSVFKGERRTTLDALAGELHSSQLESGNFGKIAKTSSAESWADKIIKGKDWVRNEMISVETLMRKLDGYKNNGVWWKSLFEGYAESADGRAMDMVQTAEKQAKMWEAYTAKERETMDSRKLYVPEFRVSLTKTEIMTIALNWGNAMNKQRLLEGSGGYQDSRGKMWTEKDVQAVLDREMSKRDWDTVQQTWDLVNSFWPRIAEMYKRITGFEPGKISAEPLTTPHGVYEGGYFPLRRDTRLDVRGNEQMKTDEMLGDIPAWRASTKNGFIESRVRGAVYPVSLDIRGVSKHLTDVIHDLNLREWVLDSNRILGNKEVQVSLQDALGMEGYRVVKDWVKDVANTKGYESFDPLLREIRRRTIISTLGLRLSSVILQADDISAYGRIDPKNFGVTNAIAAISSHYSKIVTRMEIQKEAVDFVYSKSKYMKFERGENLDRDVSEASKRSFGKDDKLGKAAMYFVTSADHILSIPVWKEAYKVGLKLNSGNEKLSVAYADGIIRRAQSSGRLGEMPKIMRGGEFQKALTMFYSFVSKRANIWYEQIDKTKGLSDVPELVGTAAALWVLPSIFSALVHDGLPTDEKKKKKYVKELLMYPFSLFPVVRDIADFAMDKAMGLPGFGYGVTPLTRGVDVLGDLITKIKSPKKGAQDKLEAVSHAASIATPYPDQINAWVFNVADYANGKMTPEARDIMKRRPVRERR